MHRPASPENGLQCGGRFLDLSRPVVMGVLNVTPDSFSDGGRFFCKDEALAQARLMVEQGAAIIDIGGESTRPGAAPVSEQEELDRVVPVIEALAGAIDAVVSVDTSTPAVMREAAAAGAGMINDVRALERPGALECVKNTALPVCLMHMQGQPESMQNNPRYQDVLNDVYTYLQARLEACGSAGIAPERIVLDPGFGFGKTLQHNLSLLKHLDQFTKLECPMLVGMSRKSMIGAVLDKPVAERLHGSVAAALIAVQSGAAIVRVHDVAPTVDALKVWSAVLESV
ncbi:MAG: dihydropteroate synthase [Alcanivorax sp.]|uniref:dihydropteroate synthase n=1 Tax=unclassified Ketobacter TaxID=2639109 RepID=UPI000F243DB3|nr:MULTISPECIES: dihydropteroate synthase [unclassified Ketobacter]RLT87982.1 MAG: dihydropteroate synthase [Ketobacter sp. GenoA1]RLT95239.1 MAG: dihydropteroate synthase [Ketobacter sp.]TNC88088.1 MAG: dihydropteroate synthase [Alcanivorax sp.]